MKTTMHPLALILHAQKETLVLHITKQVYKYSFLHKDEEN